MDTKPRKKLEKLARLSGIGFQMMVTIIIGVFIGQYLDKKYPNENSLYTLLFSLVFIGIALYAAIKQAMKIGNEN